MAGFTVSNSNKFLETGMMRDSQSLSIETPQIANTGGPSAPKTFADTLKEAVNSVNELQKSSDKAAQALATGKTDNVADVMIAAEKADIALRVMVQVRNKIIDAYQEIMKMQV